MKARMFLGLISLIPLVGCNWFSPPPMTAKTAVPVMTKAVPPDDNVPTVDLKRIKVDVEKRTVHLYPLPSNGRWSVRVPGKAQDGPIDGLDYQVPEGVDLGSVQVWLFVPGAPPSAAVSLKDVPPAAP